MANNQLFLGRQLAEQTKELQTLVSRIGNLVNVDEYIISLSPYYETTDVAIPKYSSSDVYVNLFNHTAKSNGKVQFSFSTYETTNNLSIRTKKNGLVIEEWTNVGGINDSYYCPIFDCLKNDDFVLELKENISGGVQVDFPRVVEIPTIDYDVYNVFSELLVSEITNIDTTIKKMTAKNNGYLDVFIKTGNFGMNEGIDFDIYVNDVVIKTFSQQYGPYNLKEYNFYMGDIKVSKNDVLEIKGSPNNTSFTVENVSIGFKYSDTEGVA